MAASPTPTPAPAPVPAPILSAAAHAPGWTTYHYGGALVGRYRSTDPSAHYDRVIAYLVEVLRNTRRTKTPFRDANLIWMAVNRSGG